ncbi:hypothetical protein OSK38_29820, partial [Escherichia coli]|nr:hypothetical protein [Escherichia coli]
ADILNVELEVPASSDASFGAALVAATGIGWFADLKEAAQSTESVIYSLEPKEKNIGGYEELFSIYQELHSRTYELSH